MKLLRTRITLAFAVALVAASAVAGCGGDDEDAGDEPGGALSGESTSTTTTATAEATSSGATGGPGGNSNTGTGSATATEDSGEEAEFPVGFEVDTTPHDVTSGNPCGTPVRLELIEAMVDSAEPLDPPMRSDRKGEPGDLYVHFRLAATGISGECGGANVVDRIVRLEVDGRPAFPGNDVNFIVDNGQSETFVVIYAVSPDASSFRILLGEAGEEEAAVDLEVPGFAG